MRIARRARVVALPEWVYGQRRWVAAVGKRPVCPCGRAASSTDRATWSGYEDVAQCEAYGLMLGSGLGCVDVDDCIHDGRVSPWALELLEDLEGVLAVEVSVSGTGLHAFVACDEAPGRRVSLEGGHGCEVYSRGRFIRTTEDFVDVESDGRIVRCAA